MKWLVLIVGIASNAFASVLVKIAMTPPHRLPSLREPAAALSNWPLWLGILLYGAAFVLYAVALTQLPLNVAHPILTSGAVAAVAMLSVVVLREPIYGTTIGGIVLVLAGVALITWRAR